MVEIIFGLLRAKMFTRSGKVHFFFPFLVSLIGFLQFFDIWNRLLMVYMLN